MQSGGDGQVVFNSTQVQSTLLNLQGLNEVKMEPWKEGETWGEAGSVPKCQVSHFRVQNPFVHIYLSMYPGGVL